MKPINVDVKYVHLSCMNIAKLMGTLQTTYWNFMQHTLQFAMVWHRLSIVTAIYKIFSNRKMCKPIKYLFFCVALW